MVKKERKRPVAVRYVRVGAKAKKTEAAKRPGWAKVWVTMYSKSE